MNHSLDIALSTAFVEQQAAEVTAAPNAPLIMTRVRSRRRRTAALRAGVGAVASVAVVLGGVAVANAVSRHDTTPAATPSADGGERDAVSGYGTNTLVVRIDQIDTDRLDSALVIHVSADSSRVEVLPVSQYLAVVRSECGRDPLPGNDVVLSTAYTGELGSGECVRMAVEAATGLTIDSTKFIDFAAFVDGVDALAGVPFCLSAPVAAPRAHLDLPSGLVQLTGDQALAYSRAREGDGLGGPTDNSRGERDAAVTAAVLEKFLAHNGPRQTGPLGDLLSGLQVNVTATATSVAAPIDIADDGLSGTWSEAAQEALAAFAADRPAAGAATSGACAD